MPIIVVSQAFKFLPLLGRTICARNRPFINQAWKCNHGRSFRLSSTQSRIEHTATSRLKRSRSPKTCARFVNNLNPRSIHPQDFIDLSGRYHVQCYFNKGDVDNLRPVRLVGPLAGDVTRRFPEGCRGFLYFYEDPRGRPTVSGIRFRIAKGPTQAGFDAGEDLKLYGSDEPWLFSIFQLARGRRPGNIDVLQGLCQEGLLDLDYVAKCSRMLESSGLLSDRRHPSVTKHFLMSFDEPFEFDLSIRTQRVYVFELQQSRLVLFQLCAIPPHAGKMPYKGRCIVRLEKLDEKPTSSGETHVTYNIRVLKMLTPIECVIPGYVGVLPPKAGSLLGRGKGPLTRRSIMKSKDRLSPDAVAEKMGSKLKPALAGRQISTLNPGQLKASDHLDFGGDARIQGIWTSAKAIRTRVAGHEEYAVSVSNNIPLERTALNKYALDKKGFLYFHQSHPTNPLSGAIRFRLAEQPTIDAFHLGEDLIDPLKKSVWELPLSRLIQFKTFRPFVGQLLQDGLIKQDTVDKCLHLKPRIPSFVRAAILYELNQPFVMDLSQNHHWVYYIDANNFRIWRLRRTPKQSLNTHFVWTSCPYTGQCLVRLEEVSMESSAGSSHQLYGPVQIRVLKIHEPLGWRDPNNPHGELPTEGSILRLKARKDSPADLAYLCGDE